MLEENYVEYDFAFRKIIVELSSEQKSCLLSLLKIVSNNKCCMDNQQIKSHIDIQALKEKSCFIE